LVIITLSSSPRPASRARGTRVARPTTGFAIARIARPRTPIPPAW